ncbi:Protein FAR1-RELATED SEQUENCE [Abeliophyllum distichum]|uniref:Protein FAR1-RELATED SEQUENCE n=1 Tax=Abeliophyllum distichum TaxID=126358 RepID=A0ABD1SWZ3_9LAMI
MSNSQRSESGHSFLKKYVDRKNSLTDFVARFNRALVHQRHEKLAVNHIDLTQTPKVKDIDTGSDVSMSRNRNRNTSVEETQVVCDSNPVRAKGCEKRLKSEKEKALSQSNSLDNTNQLQYSQDPSDQQYHAPDSEYAYHVPDSQYAYHASDSQYSYHAPDPQYAYHALDLQYAYHVPNPQYWITGSNNASYSLDPQEYDARYQNSSLIYYF